jgi:hypothetical protein
MNEAAISLQQRFRCTEGVMARPVGSEMVALNLETGVYYSFNELGALIWTELAQGRTPTAIVQRIGAEYDVATDVAERDLESFLAQLLEWQLVQPA